jgi:hypothetical protein
MLTIFPPRQQSRSAVSRWKGGLDEEELGKQIYWFCRFVCCFGGIGSNE